MTDRPTTLGALRASGFPDRTVKQELRANLLAKLAAGEELFPGLVGFDDSVLPALERGILAGHDLILLGERGQAKTRLVRALVQLLDERHAGDRGHRDQRPPLPADQRARPRARGRARRRDAARVDRPRRPLRREARDPRHERRRPDRRRRPDQGGRGPLPRRRGHDPLRPDPAHEPWHRRDQRAARPARAHPGLAVQHPRGTRRADPRLPHPAAARHAARGDREPRRLHAPRTHRLARSRTASAPRSARTTRRPCARRSASWIRRLRRSRAPCRCACRPS